jgi:hypothetical protein
LLATPQNQIVPGAIATLETLINCSAEHPKKCTPRKGDQRWGRGRTESWGRHAPSASDRRGERTGRKIRRRSRVSVGKISTLALNLKIHQIQFAVIINLITIDVQSEKQDEPRISTLHGITID